MVVGVEEGGVESCDGEVESVLILDLVERGTVWPVEARINKSKRVSTETTMEKRERWVLKSRFRMESVALRYLRGVGCNGSAPTEKQLNQKP